jgi:myosin heavy chain 6/7
MIIDFEDPEVIESFSYLYVSDVDKYKYKRQKFDPAKDVLAKTTDKDGYIPVTIQLQDEKKGCYIVKTRQATLMTCPKDNTIPMNPPALEKVEDMAELSELNDPTLLHNIRERYVGSNLIYTYSSMFCIAVNPYRDLPIYTRKMIQFYCGKKKGEAPPHVFYMADSAYSGMRRERRNQSILIT